MSDEPTPVNDELAAEVKIVNDDLYQRVILPDSKKQERATGTAAAAWMDIIH